MLVSSSDSRDLLSVMYYLNKVRMVYCQVMKSAQWIRTWMKLTVMAVSKSSSTEVMDWYRALKFTTLLDYEYAQVVVDLFRENVTLIHCSVVVCNYVSPFFLYLKECVVISKFGSTVSCGLTRETRLRRHKPIAWHTHLLDCMKCSTLNGDPFTQLSFSDENKVLYGRIVVCLSQKQWGYLTKYIIHWNWDIRIS